MLTAEKAIQISEANQINYLLSLIEKEAMLGRRKLTHYDKIGGHVCSELGQLGFNVTSVTDDTATWYEIDW